MKKSTRKHERGHQIMETIYPKLRKQLDQYSVGFPEAKSGVDLKILKKLYTEPEAELFLDLSMQLEDPVSVAGRTNRDAAETAEMLETMAKKGLVFRKKKQGTAYYAAIPFVIGSFEFQLNRMDKPFAQMVEAYFNEVYLHNLGDFLPPLRTIPVNHSIDATQKVAPYSDARAIIQSKDKIAIANCICRTQNNLLEKGCGKPLEVCFVFGSHAEYYLDNKMARQIDHDEALAILDKCEEAGLVHQPANMINPGGMCNCCGDCCGVLRALNKLPRPAEQVANIYWASVDPERCTGCELCMERCQMQAIQLNEDQISTINTDRCIGCGLCVTSCPAEALSMVVKPEDKQMMPPESGMDLMIKTAEKRGTSLIPLSMTEK
ncbi:MAG: 4Fe-4S binding protein [Pseudomonadota bacterium]